MTQKYKRILLKLSGEGLMGKKPYGIDDDVLNTIAESVQKVYESGIELCIVIGGGNFYRGVNNKNLAVSRSVADQAGMLATAINALFLKSALCHRNLPATILSGLAIPQIADTYSYHKAEALLQKKSIIIFSGGTGNPYFTTDTGATLRALETKCDALFKATQVDGVYDSDPKLNSQAKRYTEISYNNVIAQNLKVMDITAITMAKENNLPIVVFKQEDNFSLINAINGKGNLTTIK